jgi:hypothetical protein
VISELERLIARPGQRIKPRVSALLLWIKRQQLEAGYGIRLKKTSQGTMILAAVPSPTFIGDFYVSLAPENSFYVSRGFVNGIEPTINRIRITGESDKQRPSIKVPTEFDENGRAYIYIEATVGDNGRIDDTKPESLIVDAGKSLASGDRLKGRHAIAMFRETSQGKSPILYQVAYFSYRHAFNGKKHFFVVA